MSIAELNEQFARRGASLPGHNETAAVRRAALARFEQLGLPGRALETWHYTDLSSLAAVDLDYLGAVPDPARCEAARAKLAGLELAADGPRLVFLDGHLIDGLSVLPAAAGLDILPLDQRPGELLASAADDPALVALNTALARGGALIRVSGRSVPPVELVFIADRAGTAAQLRLRFELAAGASLTAVQHLVDLGGAGPAWLNLVADAELGAGSELSLYRLQQLGGEQTATALTRATLAERSILSAATVEIGAALSRNEYEIALAGEEARTEVRGLALTRARQHCDTRVAVDHRSPRTISRQDYRAIAADRSRSVFNGKVTVRKGAQHVDARQRNDNLLLTASAEIDTKPELEIYADQVVCSHGATVGELSEEQLFYLRSRGIGAEAARAILITAFADVILREFALEAFRDRARTAVAADLPRRLAIG